MIQFAKRNKFKNIVFSGAFRGFGVPQATALQETLMDQLADKLQIDQLEFRLKTIGALLVGQISSFL